jgi:hypothetical protein
MFGCVAIGVLAAGLAAGSACTRPSVEGFGVAHKLRLIPAASSREPWLAVTDAPAGEVLGTGGEIPPLRLSIEGVKVIEGQNVSIKVFVNTLRPAADTLMKDPHFVTQGFFFPASADRQSFTTDPGPALRRLAKIGELRLDRPLIFLVTPEPGVEGRPFGLKDWTIERATLIVGEK